MGLRHLHGMAELQRVRKGMMTLQAVADPDRERREALADEAERLLGRRPRTYRDLEALIGSASVEAVDIATVTQSHAAISSEALEASLEVLVEKPLAVTVRDCLRLITTAKQSGRQLAVAENVRREASYRLSRAVITSGMLGEPRFVVDQSFSGKDAILLTPWRHRRQTGGILLDDGVHSADVIEYLAGPVARVAASIRLVESVRRSTGDAGPVASRTFYQRWAAQMPSCAEADAEDEAMGLLRFAGGATGSWIISRASHGAEKEERWVYGPAGSLWVPPDRSGRSPIVVLDDGHVLEGQALVDATPGYRLEGVSAAVFGGARPAPRQASFAEQDRKLIAIELADFVEAVQTGRTPEVDAVVGTRNVALVWALCEAAVTERWIDVADVESGHLNRYQMSLDAI
jgi:predicted dehydrogenase